MVPKYLYSSNFIHLYEITLFEFLQMGSFNIFIACYMLSLSNGGQGNFYHKLEK